MLGALHPFPPTPPFYDPGYLPPIWGLHPIGAKQHTTKFLQNSKILKEFDFDLQDSTVLDGFCGTGSVGFEALSRGAEFITFIDNDVKHINIVKGNAKLLGEEKNCEFLCKDITKDYLANCEDGQYNLIFLDPPYDSEFSTYDKNTFDREDQKRLANFSS